jgi:hypothetical protein
MGRHGTTRTIPSTTSAHVRGQYGYLRYTTVRLYPAIAGLLVRVQSGEHKPQVRPVLRVGHVTAVARRLLVVRRRQGRLPARGRGCGCAGPIATNNPRRRRLADNVRGRAQDRPVGVCTGGLPAWPRLFCSAVFVGLSGVPQDRPAPGSSADGSARDPTSAPRWSAQLTQRRRPSATQTGRSGSCRTCVGRRMRHRAAGGRRRVRGRCWASVRPLRGPLSWRRLLWVC